MLDSYNYLLYLSDTLVIVNKTDEYQLTFFDPRDKTVVCKNYYDKLRGVDANSFVYNTQIYDAYYSASKNIVIAYKYFQMIDIVSLNGTLLKRVKFETTKDKLPNFSRVNKRNVDMTETTVYYTFVYSTDNFFYALCWNSDKKDINKADSNSEAHQFDWNGNLVNVFQFDMPVSYFCVDETNRIIYGIGYSKELDLGIYKFDY
jgi:hypothetical protein